MVGVSGDIRDVRLEVEPPPMLFLPHAQIDLPAMTLIVRTSLETASVAPALRQALRDLDPALPAPAINQVSDSRAAATA